MPKPNMAVYLRHFLGVDKAAVLEDKPKPLRADMQMPILANVMRDGIRDAEIAMLREAGCEFMPGMIIMAPSPEETRRNRQVLEAASRAAGTPVGFISAIVEQEKKVGTLYPHQLAILDAMKNHPPFQPVFLDYKGIQPRRFQIDKLYGKEPSCVIADEIHQPVTVLPPKKEST